MSIYRRIANLFTRSKVQREIERELASHLDLRIEDNLAAGMSPRQARRDAILRFGNRTSIHERTHEADALLYFESLWMDLRLSTRQLRKSPSYSITAILTLALAIGSNTAVFSVVRATLLQQLPFDDPSRVYDVENGDSAGLEFNFGSRDFEASFNNTAHSFQSIDNAAIYSSSGANAILDGVSMRLHATETSARFLEVLGVTPQLGRGFRPGEDIPGKDQEILLSDRLWREGLHEDPAVVGKKVKVNGFDFTVVGVLPPRMDFPEKTGLWTPTIFDEHTFLREGGAFITHVIVRARRGVTPAQLRAEFNARALQNPGAKSSAPNRMPALTPIAAELTKSIRRSVLVLSSAVLLVLLAACANLAGLMLVRGSQRRAEFAVRAALGGTRSRLIQQQLVESMLIAFCGAALGIGFAREALRLLMMFRPAALNNFKPPAIDPGVLLFTACAAILSGIVFGMLPAWQASREDPLAALKAGVWRSSTSTTAFRKVLVGGEIALAAVLLIGACLLLRTMRNINSVPLGFDTGGILSFSISVHGGPYATDGHSTPALAGFYSNIVDRIRALPGVTAAAAISSLPLDTRSDMLLPLSSDLPKAKAAAAPRFASAGYFSAMRIPILEGRDFSAEDTRTSAPVVIVTRDIAQKLWPGQDPIGRVIHCLWYCKQPPRVVGVVAPSRHFGPLSDPFPEYYTPFTQQDWPYMTFVARTQSDPAMLAPEIRRAVSAIDPTQPLYDLTTMQQRLNDNESLQRFRLYALSVFAALSGVLAWIGLYGLIAFTVTQRIPEIGVRTALGASRASILILVMRQGMTLAVLGVLIGLGGAMLASRGLAALLFEVSRLDPLTYVAVATLLLCVSAIACFVPARRAASVNPVEALRAE